MHLHVTNFLSQLVLSTINEDEKEQFVEHINSTLKSDKQIGSRFPINAKTMQIFEECKGVLNIYTI